MRVVLAGGGTAGHIEPALAIAAEFERSGVATQSELHFVGGYRGLEGRLVPARGYQLHQIDIVGLPRKLNIELLKYPVKLWLARRKLIHLFTQIKPEVVIGFGGYVAAPSYLAAKKLNIPIVVHEANARPGVANRRASKFATLNIDSFAGSMSNAITLGVPIRDELSELDRSGKKSEARKYFQLPDHGKTLLVFGGSQGAERINQAISAIASELTFKGINILHIVGDLNLAKYQTKELQNSGVYRVLGYCDRMDLAYAAADLAVTRSGALTVAELSAVGLPSILVPYPVGNGEQELNAAELVAAGGGVMLLNQNCTPTQLKAQIIAILNAPERIESMTQSAKSIARPDAAIKIVKKIVEVIK